MRTMPEYEREAREAVAKALEAEGWPTAARNTLADALPSESMTAITLRALLPLLSEAVLSRPEAQEVLRA